MCVDECLKVGARLLVFHLDNMGESDSAVGFDQVFYRWCPSVMCSRECRLCSGNCRLDIDGRSGSCNLGWCIVSKVSHEVIREEPLRTCVDEGMAKSCYLVAFEGNVGDGIGERDTIL